MKICIQICYFILIGQLLPIGKYTQPVIVRTKIAQRKGPTAMTKNISYELEKLE